MAVPSAAAAVATPATPVAAVAPATPVQAEAVNEPLIILISHRLGPPEPMAFFIGSVYLLASQCMPRSTCIWFQKSFFKRLSVVSQRLMKTLHRADVRVSVFRSADLDIPLLAVIPIFHGFIKSVGLASANQQSENTLKHV